MYLTGIVFIMAVIAIALEWKDAFPQHRELRTAAMLLAVGLFLGLGAHELLIAKFSLGGHIDAGVALLFAIGAIAALLGLSALLIRDRNRKVNALALTGASIVILAMCSLGVGVGSAIRHLFIP